MLKHVIYGSFGLLAAVVIAAAIYFDTPAPHTGSETSAGVLAGEEGEWAEGEGFDTQIAGAAASDGQELFALVKVIDGDTISITKGNSNEMVRIIGLNAPETGQCFTAEATAKLKSLLARGQVRLEFDGSQGERDKYDRLLAYVFTESGINTAKTLIEGGFAKEYTYSKAYKYQTEFKAAQTSAQVGGKGLWASGACATSATKPAPTQTVVPVVIKQEPPPSQEVEDGGKEDLSPLSDEVESGGEDEPPPKPPPASSGSYTQAPSDGAGYTCSSNAYNCGDFSTHAEAQAVYEACGGASNDIHRLDANKDGLACESLP